MKTHDTQTDTQDGYLSDMVRVTHLSRRNLLHELSVSYRKTFRRGLPSPNTQDKDLNAIQALCEKAVKKYGPSWQVRFQANLYYVLGWHDHVETEAILAKAKQRCQAYVLTMRHMPMDKDNLILATKDAKVAKKAK